MFGWRSNKKQAVVSGKELALIDRTSINRNKKANSELLVGATVIAAAILFIGTGSNAINVIFNRVGDFGAFDKRMVMTTLLLNIALILFGWRRYRDLQMEMQDRITAEQRAQKLAITDPLTGFYNRRAISQIAADLCVTAAAKEQSVAFMMLDLDNFKRINDMNGHAAGDFLLTQFAERMQKIAPSRAYLARIGGDEFAFAFTFNPNVPEEVTRFAEAIIEETERPIIHDNLVLETTVSIGIARHDGNDGGVDKLMQRADIAMYNAKRNGKNDKSWFTEEMEQELRARIDVEAAIRLGIPRGEFVPYFEQQVDIRTGRLTGFEMLARWDAPAHRHVPVETFIDVAQEAGLIGDLSISIMEKAFLEAKNWDPSLTIAVNISPVQLLDERLAQRILKLLVETGFPPQRLEVEITEGAIFKNVELAQTIIHSLKNQGIRVAYDDFGTGYSSLTHLRELPFDRIKIDRSFISSVARDKDSADMVRGITSLCRSLGLPITAEGIEDELVERFVADLGDFTAQGWFYGRPLSIVGARKLLAERNLLPARRSEQPDIFASTEVEVDLVTPQSETPRTAVA